MTSRDLINGLAALGHEPAVGPGQAWRVMARVNGASPVLDRRVANMGQAISLALAAMRAGSTFITFARVDPDPAHEVPAEPPGATPGAPQAEPRPPPAGPAWSKCPACGSAYAGSRCPRCAQVKPFRVEYEHKGKTYVTVVDAYTREAALVQFRRDNPHVEPRQADEDRTDNVAVGISSPRPALLGCCTCRFWIPEMQHSDPMTATGYGLCDVTREASPLCGKRTYGDTECDAWQANDSITGAR